MYSSNLVNLVSEYWDSEAKHFSLDMEDDILQGCVITHGGVLVNAAIQSIRGQGA
jgi:NAD(P) transhydrogenase subunit alpha